MSKLYDDFMNLYPVTKTLRFELIPQGRTLEKFLESGILEEDEHRAESYKVVKGFIDEYHKAFIEDALSGFEIKKLDEYAGIYYKSSKNDKEKKAVAALKKDFRKQIVKAFKENKKYKSLFNKDIIEKELSSLINDDAEKQKRVAEFKKFTTYFKGFHKNRENMYSDEEKSTAISYRIINDNLPRFLDNIKVLEKARDLLSSEAQIDIADEIANLGGSISADEYIKVESFNTVLTQKGIDTYNAIMGIVNKYANLHDQISDRQSRIGKVTALHKQILSDRVKLSWVPEIFVNDQEVLTALGDASDNLSFVVKRINEFLKSFDKYNPNGIYIKNDRSITDISSKVYKNWNTIYSSLISEYDEKNLKGTPKENYIKKRDKAITKDTDSYSLAHIESVVNDSENSIIEYFMNQDELFEAISKSTDELQELAVADRTNNRKLQNDDASISVIKNYLDSVLELQHLIKLLLGKGDEPDKDNSFYAELNACWEEIGIITPLYNKVRNYVTQKPYSNEKIKLNFGNPQLLGGWPIGREQATSSILFKDQDYYYLGIMDNNYRKDFSVYPEPSEDDDCLYKMFYLQTADPQRDVQNLMVIDGKTVKKNGRKNDNGENVVLEELKNEYLPKEINEIRKKRSYSKTSESFNVPDLIKFIDYYKERVKEYYLGYKFDFLESNCYRDFGKFTDHINAQAYQVRFEPVSKSYIYKCVDEGKLYLFKIYNKDFSPYSKGTPNLHTLYWKMLFDERNLDDVVYKLNGEAEVFYRRASINNEEKITHNANEPIDNKNPNNDKKRSVFEYDIVKDRRYTVDKFQFHVPITLNYKAIGIDDINELARRAIKKNESPYVIGIDRGERHLLYLVLIDPDGKIVEQKSLNEIVSGNMKINYHNLLDKREKEHDVARKNWQTIEGIKELKEGYLSQVVHEISKLMIKYNAIVVLEDLNIGFMRGRQKIEKQVYQKFEHTLINKLNYLVDKTLEPTESGGLLHAYQLANEFEGFNKLGKQSGMLFYIPAWNTSKMDPTTGFVNLFYVKYESVEKSKAFWKKFKSIKYNNSEEYFEFDFDYNDFTAKADGTKTKWTVCSNGTRINTFKNSEKNNEWDNEEINLTQSIKELLENHNISSEGNLVDAICENNSASFHRDFMHLFKLTLQMRNSITGSKIDYLVSPVKNSKGEFYHSDNSVGDLPANADANGAYNIARKGQWIVKQIKACDEDNLKKLKIDITNKEWLRYAQEHC